MLVQKVSKRKLTLAEIVIGLIRTSFCHLLFVKCNIEIGGTLLHSLTFSHLLSCYLALLLSCSLALLLSCSLALLLSCSLALLPFAPISLSLPEQNTHKVFSLGFYFFKCRLTRYISLSRPSHPHTSTLSTYISVFICLHHFTFFFFSLALSHSISQPAIFVIHSFPYLLSLMSIFHTHHMPNSFFFFYSMVSGLYNKHIMIIN